MNDLAEDLDECSVTSDKPANFQSCPRVMKIFIEKKIVSPTSSVKCPPKLYTLFVVLKKNSEKKVFVYKNLFG